MLTMIIKIDKSQKSSVNKLIDSVLLSRKVLLKDLSDSDSLLLDSEQITFYVKDNSIMLTNSFYYYQTPFLLPRIIPYSANNLIGLIHFYLGEYDLAKEFFDEKYLQSICGVVDHFSKNEKIPDVIFRELIDYNTNFSTYYTNMAILHHYNNSLIDRETKKYLYIQALEYCVFLEDQIHLIKYYLLFLLQHEMYQEGEIFIKKYSELSKRVKMNFEPVLDKYSLQKAIQAQKEFSFQNLPRYFKLYEK